MQLKAFKVNWALQKVWEIDTMDVLVKDAEDMTWDDWGFAFAESPEAALKLGDDYAEGVIPIKAIDLRWPNGYYEVFLALVAPEVEAFKYGYFAYCTVL